MNRPILFGVLVVALSVAACGGSNSSTSSSTAATGSIGAAASTGRASSAAGTTGSGGSGGNASSGASATGSSGGAAGSSTGGSSTGGAGYTVSTVPGGGVMSGSCGPDGSDAVFSPQLLVLDGMGNIYVTSDELDKIAPGGALTTLTGLSPPANGLAATAAGAVYFSQTANFSSATTITQATGSSTMTIYTPMMSPSCVDTGAMSGLGGPAGIAADAQGNIYVADEVCFEIRKITSGGALSTLAGTAMVEGDANGPGSMATFSQLAAIAIDPNGVIYVAESNTSLIREIQPDGTTSTLVATSASNIGGLAADGNGNVYFSDSNNNIVRKVDSSGHITTIAGTGAMGYMDGPGKMAEFSSPAGVGVDGMGNVFVADSSNCVVREISPGM